MKKILFILSIIAVLSVAGCGTKSEDDANNVNDETNTEAEEDTNSSENNQEASDETGGEEVGKDEKGELTLQLLKKDEEEGLTLENNEIYKAVQEEVEADPLMGDQDDLSLYPFDIVEFEDGSSSVMFLVINRLDKPIRNLVFNLTFGNQEGEYVFEDVQVDLPEEYLGVLDKDGVVPTLVEMDEEDEELFYSLTQENVFLELDNVGIDFAD